MREYDLVVIGSGPGGQKAAIAAAKLGKTVAAIEHDRMLGACAPTSAPSPSCSGAARVSLAVHLQKRQAVGQILPVRAAIRVGCEEAAGVSLFRGVSYDNSDNDNEDDSRATRRLHLHDNGTRIVPGGTIGLCLRITSSFSSAPHPPRRSYCML
jgi:succinate dehydrogenase/fumarate reductase flavoprotein subunit